ncbi:hypothetical protein ACIBCT_30845 [Streptosporangium sp. NPDC050855]
MSSRPVVVDAMGGDHGPVETVACAVARDLSEGGAAERSGDLFGAGPVR